MQKEVEDRSEHVYPSRLTPEEVHGQKKEGRESGSFATSVETMSIYAIHTCASRYRLDDYIHMRAQIGRWLLRCPDILTPALESGGRRLIPPNILG